MSFSPATQYLTEEESILHRGLYWMCMRISGRTCPRRVKLAQSWIWIQFCVERGRASGRYALQFVGNFFLYFPWLHSLTTRYDIKSLLAYKMNSAFLYIEGHAFVEFIAVYSWLRRYFTRLWKLQMESTAVRLAATKTRHISTTKVPCVSNTFGPLQDSE